MSRNISTLSVIKSLQLILVHLLLVLLLLLRFLLGGQVLLHKLLQHGEIALAGVFLSLKNININKKLLIIRAVYIVIAIIFP